MTAQTARAAGLRPLLEHARARKIDYRAIYRRGVLSGHLDVVRIGGRWYASDVAVEAWLAGESQ